MCRLRRYGFRRGHGRRRRCPRSRGWRSVRFEVRVGVRPRVIGCWVTIRRVITVRRIVAPEVARAVETKLPLVVEPIGMKSTGTQATTLEAAEAATVDTSEAARVDTSEAATVDAADSAAAVR